VIVVTTVTLTRINLTFLSENMKESKGEEANLTYLVVIVSVACLTLLLVVFLIAFFLR
jgi:hypothetical protein